MSPRRCIAIAAASLIAACGGESTGPPGAPAQLVKTGGDNQAWYFSNPLPVPYAAAVRDSNGRGVPGIAVIWTVTAGGGSVDSTQSRTDNAGIARVVHTLGPSAAAQSVDAFTVDFPTLPLVTFTATAGTPPASAMVDLVNLEFQPRVTAVVVGGTATWTWNDAGTAHNMLFTRGPPPLPTGSGVKSSGTLQVTFNSTGRYDYACTIHSGMEGTIHVVN